MAIPGQNVDFSWLANLPATWDEAQARADVRGALKGLDTSDPDALDAAARALLRSGRDKSIQLGINLSALASKRRELEQEQSTAGTIGKFLSGVPTGTAPTGGIPQPPGIIKSSIDEHAARTGVDPEILTRQVYQESGYNPNATGAAGERGVSQFIPATAKEYNVDTSSVSDSIRGQADYMRDLTKKYNGNTGLALAAYNAGPGKVDDYLSGKISALPQITQNYVRSITGRPIEDWTQQTPSVAQAGPVIRQQPTVSPDIQRQIAETSAAMGMPGIKKGQIDALGERLKFLYGQAAKPTPEEEAALARARRTPPEEAGASAAATTLATGEKEEFNKEMASHEANAASAEKILQTTGRMQSIMERPEFVSGLGTTTVAGAASGALSVANLAKQAAEASGTQLPDWMEKGRVELTKRVRLAEDFTSARNALTFNLAHGKLSQGFTDKDREFVNNINAGPETSIAGNKALLETARANAEDDKKLAQVARDYRKSAGAAATPTGLGEAIAAWRADHPLFVNPDGSLTARGKKINDIAYEDTAAAKTAAPPAPSRTITTKDEGRPVVGPDGKRYRIRGGELVPEETP